MKKLLFILIFPFFIACSLEDKIITIDNLYQIEIPKGMTSMPGIMGNDDASAQYGNVFSEKYLMVINESKSEWIDLLIEENLNNKEYMSEYISFLSESMEDSFNSTHSLSDVYLNDSTPGKLFEIKGIIDGVDLIWNVIFVEGEDNLYQIAFWTSKGNEKKIVQLLSAAKTFKEL